MVLAIEPMVNAGQAHDPAPRRRLDGRDRRRLAAPRTSSTPSPSPKRARDPHPAVGCGLGRGAPVPASEGDVMPSSRSRTLSGHANQAGTLLAAANAPLTFQRTLMPRSTMDQALVTGLSAGGQPRARSPSCRRASKPSRSSWRARPVTGGSTNGVGAGRRSRPTSPAIVAGLGVQRALHQQPREPLSRAGRARAGSGFRSRAPRAGWRGFSRSSSTSRVGVAGRSRSMPRPRPCSRAPTPGMVRRRARLDADLPPEETAGVAREVDSASALGVVGAACRRSARASGSSPTWSRRRSRACCPGNDALWRPVGARRHARRSRGGGPATSRVTRLAPHRDVSRSSVAGRVRHPAAEPAGRAGASRASCRSTTLSRAGRAVRVDASSPDRSHRRGHGRDGHGRADPRVRRARERRRRGRERVDLLDARARAHRARSTGRGSCSRRRPAPATSTTPPSSILEFLTRGDCATRRDAVRGAAVTAVARPGEGRPPADADARATRSASGSTQCPPERAAEGACCSARASARGRARTRSSTTARKGSSTRASTTRSGSARRTSASGRSRCSTTTGPTSTARSSACSTTSASARRSTRTARERIRYVMITHYDDGVGVFGPELAIQAPEWLGRPETPATDRCPRACAGCRPTAFFQVLVDMKNAANVVPGVFAAKGHDYRADLLPFFARASLGFDVHARATRARSAPGSSTRGAAAASG